MCDTNEITFDENVYFDDSEINQKKVKMSNQERVKISDQEKALIREALLAGIPIQRIKDIIKIYNEDFKDDFIGKLQSYYNKMVAKDLQELSLVDLSNIFILIKHI